MSLKNKFGLIQIPLLVGLLLMAVAVPVATKLVQQNQDSRNLAYVPDCEGGDRECYGTGYRVCQASGKWGMVVSCTGGCANGYCKSCVPNTVCAKSTCEGYKCSDGCGGMVDGTKDCSTPTDPPERTCGDKPVGTTECLADKTGFRKCGTDGEWASTNCATNYECKTGEKSCSLKTTTSTCANQDMECTLVTMPDPLPKCKDSCCDGKYYQGNLGLYYCGNKPSTTVKPIPCCCNIGNSSQCYWGSGPGSCGTILGQIQTDNAKCSGNDPNQNKCLEKGDRYCENNTNYICNSSKTGYDERKCADGYECLDGNKACTEKPACGTQGIECRVGSVYGAGPECSSFCCDSKYYKSSIGAYYCGKDPNPPTVKPIPCCCNWGTNSGQCYWGSSSGSCGTVLGQIQTDTTKCKGTNPNPTSTPTPTPISSGNCISESWSGCASGQRKCCEGTMCAGDTCVANTLACNNTTKKCSSDKYCDKGVCVTYPTVTPGNGGGNCISESWSGCASGQRKCCEGNMCAGDTCVANTSECSNTKPCADSVYKYCNKEGVCVPYPTATPGNGGGGGSCKEVLSGNLLQCCNPKDSDGTSADSLCNSKGKEVTCGGKDYCCPSSGGNWTTDMNQCNNGGGENNNCKSCPTDFGCYVLYKNNVQSEGVDEYKWFAPGYVMNDFVKVEDRKCSDNGVKKPTYLGKSKGDANCDGVINNYDLSTWRSEYITSGGNDLKRSNWEADFNCDQVVDIYDRSTWRDSYRLYVGN